MARSKLKTDANMAMIAVFSLLLVLPVARMNRVKAKISSVENRQLASLPPVFLEDGKLNRKFRSEFEAYIGDNMGFRNSVIKWNTRLNVNVLKVSNSPNVRIGKDGWYFYTGDHNLELADGRYELTEATLERWSINQKRMRDYYRARGIDYAMIINPSKASVYPEKLRTGLVAPVASAADILADSLNRDGVTAISTRRAVLSAKTDGHQVFFKTDTHLSRLGYYHAYKEICRRLGITPADIDGIGAESRKTDLSRMLGGPDILPAESAPNAIVDTKGITWTHGSTAESGEWFARLRDLCQPVSNGNCYVSDNPNAERGTLMVYADSHFGAGLMDFLAFNFKRVVIVHMAAYAPVSPALENFVQPEFVMRSMAERYANSGVLYSMDKALQESPTQ